MTHARTLLISLLLTGCSKAPYTEEDFNDDLAEAECSLMMECSPKYQAYFESLEACVSFYQTIENIFDTGGSERESDCTFHSDEARACITAYKTLTCDDVSSPAENNVEERMAVCQEVYTGDCGGSYGYDTGR